MKCKNPICKCVFKTKQKLIIKNLAAAAKQKCLLKLSENNAYKRFSLKVEINEINSLSQLSLQKPEKL